MADYLSLAQILAQADQENAQDNPYYQGRDLFSGIGEQALRAGVQNPDRFSSTETAGVSALSGLLSGIFQGIGDNAQKDRDADFYNLLMGGIETGKVSPRPDTVSPALYNKAVTLGQLYNLQSKRDAALLDAESERDMEKMIGQAMLTDPGAAKVGLPQYLQYRAAIEALKRGKDPQPIFETQGDKGPLDRIRELPKSEQPEALKEFQKLSDSKKSTDFPIQQFNQAKDLGLLDSWNPWAENSAEQIAQALKTDIQARLGREMNGPEQEQFLKLLPGRYDTDAQLEAKKARYLDLLKSIAPSTPILDATGISATTPTGSDHGSLRVINGQTYKRSSSGGWKPVGAIEKPKDSRANYG